MVKQHRNASISWFDHAPGPPNESEVLLFALLILMTDTPVGQIVEWASDVLVEEKRFLKLHEAYTLLDEWKLEGPRQRRASDIPADGACLHGRRLVYRCSRSDWKGYAGVARQGPLQRLESLASARAPAPQVGRQGAGSCAGLNIYPTRRLAKSRVSYMLKKVSLLL